MAGGCHCLFHFPHFKPLPSLSLKPAYLKVLPFLPRFYIATRPPPLTSPWSSSSRSAQSQTTSLFFLWRRQRDVRMDYTPLADSFSRLSTREQLRPVFPKYHAGTTKLSKLRYGTLPTPHLNKSAPPQFPS